MSRPSHPGYPQPTACARQGGWFVLVLLWTATIVTAAEPATTAAPGMDLPGVGSSVVRVFGALAMVIALLLGGAWAVRNWQRFGPQRGRVSRLNVLEVKPLGQRHALYVIGYQQQRLLLATSPAGVSLVSHLPESAEEEPANEAVLAPSFAAAFQQLLARKA